MGRGRLLEPSSRRGEVLVKADTTEGAERSPDEWRDQMVKALRRPGVLSGETLSPPVERALRTVPRHLFAPEAELKDAYAPDGPVAIKHDVRGRRTSSLSSAHTQATMLQQAGVRPGTRVLEIGSGGYNAALLAELVGPEGEVTTVDIDPDITERARCYLDEAGYGRVRVVTADAEHGVAEHAPYDRILVTAGAWDIPPAWWEQLAPEGRLVVPLRMRGTTRTIAFDRADDGHLVSRDDHHLTVFVPILGEGAHADHGIAVGEGVELFLAQNETDASAVASALRGPRIEVWPGVEFLRPDHLTLWTAGQADRYALLHDKAGVLEPGPHGPAAPIPMPALLGEEGSVALRTKRPLPEEGRFEVGVLAYGPHAKELAEDYAEILRSFDSEKVARIQVWPSGTPDQALPSGRVRVLDKAHTRVVLSWS